MPTKDDLKYFQAMPLDIKISMSNRRLWEWISYYGSDGVYVSFSGGKDSSVLADLYARLCQQCGCKMFLCFVNTGLEYPEIQKFVKWYAEWLRQTYNIEVELVILRPEMRFDEVIKKYGYPIISKEISECVEQGRKALERNDGTYKYRLAKLQGQATDKNGHLSLFNRQKYEPLLYTDFIASSMCCAVMKKKPAKKYSKETDKKPITAQMAAESQLRTQQWLKNGCNGFDMKSPISNPMSFWTEQDVLQYIKQYNIPIASVYGDVVYEEQPNQLRIEGCEGGKLATTGCDRTGCIFCAFGCHLEKEPSRFQRLKETHPKQYEYCIGGGEYVDGIWQPNKDGLGMGHVFDELNKIYGEGFIKY